MPPVSSQGLNAPCVLPRAMPVPLNTLLFPEGATDAI